MKMMQTILALCSVAIMGCAIHTEPDQPSVDAKQSASPVTNVVLPIPGQISGFKADPVPALSHCPGFRIDRNTLSEVLTSWHQVSAEHWRHGYSHVAMEDRTGTLKLKDGSIIHWMVKPGGLAFLSLPDGRTVYLAKELTRWKGIAE